MKLITAYSLATGSKIDRPHIQTNPYPLPFQRYITIQDSSGMRESKDYSYWMDVLDLLIPHLKKNNIEIVQIGDKDVPTLKIAHSLCGKTNIYQTAYIIKNSMLHIGNDSFACHMAGAFNVPLVAIYGPTTVSNHGPYWYNKEKTYLIESHRNGKLPSFTSKEEEKTINLIKPEEIANAVLKVFEQKTLDHKTVYIGYTYPTWIFEFIPDSNINPNFQRDALLNVRMDYYFDEKILAETLSYRKCNILTDKPLGLDYLRAFKQNIKLISYELDDTTDLNYIEQVQKLGIQLDLVANPRCDLNNIRFKFLDYEVHKKDIFDKKSIDLPDGIGYSDLKFKTNKFILSNGKMYTSHSHVKRNIPVKTFWNNECDVIDEDIFWEDASYFNFYHRSK
jgi:hypothetical protein